MRGKPTERLPPTAMRGDASPRFGRDMAKVDGARATMPTTSIHSVSSRDAPSPTWLRSIRERAAMAWCDMGPILVRESSRRIDPTALSQPCVV
jgi:hypothetical protein